MQVDGGVSRATIERAAEAGANNFVAGSAVFKAEDAAREVEELRRLSALGWAYTQRGLTLDRRDRHIATVLAGIRNSHAAPPRQKAAILPEDLLAMLETCDRGSLRGLRDRAMLLLGFAGGLRRID